MYLEKLRNFYKNDCLFYLISFGLSPYLITYQSCAWFQDPKGESDNDLAYAWYQFVGAALCTVFTIIPILPLLTALTLSTALIAGAIALISPIITYPLAMLVDYIAEHTVQFNKLDKSFLLLPRLTVSAIEVTIASVGAGLKTALRFILSKKEAIQVTKQLSTDVPLSCKATSQPILAPSTSSAPRSFFSAPQQATSEVPIKELKI